MMYKVIIENLGGAGGTIEAECPGRNAATILATTVAKATLMYRVIRIYENGFIIGEKTFSTEWAWK